jgi:prepilin-type N-terminal cleavage/methylation domain-containing protein
MTRAIERDAGREGGFTLIELLISVAILGIVAPAIAFGIIVGLKNFGGASTRVSNSTSAQLAATYYPADISSTGNGSGDLLVDPAFAVGNSPSGNYVQSNTNVDCSNPIVGNNLLRLHWTSQDADKTSHSYVAAYVLAQDSKGWSITRYYCADGGSAQVNRIIRNVAGNSASDVAVTVSGGNNNRVKLQVKGVAQRPAEPDGFTWSLTGYRRST